MHLSIPSSRRAGVTLVVIGAFCFSLAIPFTRWTEGLSIGAIAFFRALFGFLFLCTLATVTRQPIRPALRRAVLHTLIALGLAVSATVTLYTYAVQHTTAANAALLVNSAPLYVALLAPLTLREPRPRYTWFSLALAGIGMVCIANPAQLDVRSDEMSGIAAAALSGLGYGTVMMLSRSLRGRVTGLIQNLWSNGMIVLVLIPWAVRAPAQTVLDNLPVLIPLGVFSLGLSYLLYFLGLQRISAQQVSVVSLAEPVFGVLMGLIFFAEVPNPLGCLGAALILSSIVLITR